MAPNASYDKNHREYVSFLTAYSGHLMTSALIAAVAGFSYWLLSLLFPILDIGAQNLIIFTILLVAVAELIVVLLQRPFVTKARHSDPGGMGYALPEFLVTPLLGGVGIFLISHEIVAGFVYAAVFFVFYGITGLLTKPWKPGLNRSNVRAKYDETKDMIRKDVTEEKYRDIEVDPSHRELFKKR